MTTRFKQVTHNFKEVTHKCDDRKLEWGTEGTSWARRVFVPYILSAKLAEARELTQTEAVEGFIELVMHVGTWVAAVAIEFYIIIFEFNEVGSMLHFLSVLSTVTLSISASAVILVVLFHMWREMRDCAGIADGLLAPALSGTIVANARNTLTFSKFMLFFVIFEPVNEVQGDNAVEYHVRALLGALVVLKQAGLTFTMTNHRYKVGSSTVAFT